MCVCVCTKGCLMSEIENLKNLITKIEFAWIFRGAGAWSCCFDDDLGSLETDLCRGSSWAGRLTDPDRLVQV